MLGDELAAVVGTQLAPGELMIVTAVAGGGKSTAMREYARARPDQQFLYLTFNADARAERIADFAHRGISNVVVHTLHSYAYAEMQDLHAGAPPATTSQLQACLSKFIRCNWPRANAAMKMLASFCSTTESLSCFCERAQAVHLDPELASALKHDGFYCSVLYCTTARPTLDALAPRRCNWRSIHVQHANWMAARGGESWPMRTSPCACS